MRRVASLWSDQSPVAAGVRGLLIPFEIAFRGAAGVRNWMYDRSLLHSEKADIPVVSIGNISVGGTGKTPVAAWLVERLMERGASPAVVLRDYGDDEAEVHRLLNPLAVTVASPSRAAGIRRAAQQGADVAVLDDAFQHRGVRRDEDIVLVSADRWTSAQHLLPAGPWREPLSSLSRASLAIITRKAADASQVHAASAAISKIAPHLPQAVVRLELAMLHRVDGRSTASALSRSETRLSVTAWSGKRVVAVAAVGDPEAFYAQLESAGLSLERATFPDHHPFTASEVLRLANRGAPLAAVVCTLKDAVKLAPLWPAGSGPLWYVSQSISLESGTPEVERVLTRMLALSEQSRKARDNAAARP